MGDTSTLIRLYQKVAGGSVFDLRAYLEYTEKVNMSAIYKVLTYLFVNSFFTILDLVVGFFSLILSFFDKVDLYNTYKHTVYDTSKHLWQGFLGNGNYNQSIVYVLVAISAFVIFIGYTFSKGDVGRRLLHLFVTLILGFGYYGTMQNTSGGLYVLDTIHNLSTSASKTISQISLVDPQDQNKTINQNNSITDNYIAKTAYAAYLYVNTGRLDGKYQNNQTGQLEDFDDSKVLGVNKNGSFQKANQQERDKKGGYLDDLGTGADEGKEKDRWVSSVWDYTVIKMIYVILKILEAIILGIPLVLIQCLGFLAQLVIILLIAFFPIALALSFIPRLQDILFNTMKLMGGASIFPALVGFMTLMVFYVESLVNAFVLDGFNSLSKDDLASFGEYLPALQLTMSTFLNAVVLIAFWKNKMPLLTYLMGHNSARMISNLGDKMSSTMQNLPTPKAMYDQAADSAMVAVGAGTGAAIMAKEHLGNALSKVMPDYDNPNPTDSTQDFDEATLTDLPDDSLEPDLTDLPNYEDSDYDASVPEATEDNPDLDDLMEDAVSEEDLPDYDEVTPEMDDDLPDIESTEYDAIETPDPDDVKSNEEVPAIEELIDDQPQTDSPIYEESYLEPQHQEEFPSAIEESPEGAPMPDRVQELPNAPKGNKRTSQDLPKDYKTYQLEEELAGYQNAPDLGELQAKTPFERGLKKTLSKDKQYERNLNRMSHIEKKLARLRGSYDE